MQRCADDTGALMSAFVDMYGYRVSEAVRLCKEVGEPVLLCVEDAPSEIVAGMTVVGKTAAQIRSELDADAPTVRNLLKQIQTHDSSCEGILVLQFHPALVESVVIRLQREGDSSDDDDGE